VEFVAEHPLFWLVCSFLAVVVILVCGLSTVSVQIEFDFNSFLKTDVKSAILWDIFKAAKESKPTKAGRDLSAVQSLVNKDITFTYVLTKRGRWLLQPWTALQDLTVRARTAPTPCLAHSL